MKPFCLGCIILALLSIQIVLRSPIKYCNDSNELLKRLVDWKNLVRVQYELPINLRASIRGSKFKGTHGWWREEQRVINRGFPTMTQTIWCEFDIIHIATCDPLEITCENTFKFLLLTLNHFSHPFNLFGNLFLLMMSLL